MASVMFDGVHNLLQRLEGVDGSLDPHPYYWLETSFREDPELEFGPNED